ncbi:tRNA(fMet)-specific endonuclease VapC [Silvibacterium bohemicum]|uniref:Ribonuclease VapC n=1 Tax=Silvibacterium bohemicum TaxID=1577686 RepID=A0A841JN91_9BACT|nr:type II toxin-antitoxin system VapC family toxin [Silvibacterium bohemicum]MBB6142826.1 tRNA(fMet)-specific endonuclease VapC [Silvibacterium bohemicum]
MKYLLDTNVVIDVLRNAAPALRRQLLHYNSNDIAVSAIVMHELYYGAFKSSHETNVIVTDGLPFQVLEFDREDAREAGEIRAFMAACGSTIGPFDALIAGQARIRDLILVTRNSREFAKVPGLKIENWYS